MESTWKNSKHLYFEPNQFLRNFFLEFYRKIANDQSSCNICEPRHNIVQNPRSSKRTEKVQKIIWHQTNRIENRIAQIIAINFSKVWFRLFLCWYQIYIQMILQKRPLQNGVQKSIYKKWVGWKLVIFIFS